MFLSTGIKTLNFNCPDCISYNNTNDVFFECHLNNESHVPGRDFCRNVNFGGNCEINENIADKWKGSH